MPKGDNQPHRFKPEFVEQARQLTSMGAINEELAAFFNVSLVTINNWMHKYPDFKAALVMGKDEADDRVVKSLYRRAVGYKDEDGTMRPPDVTACIFWLKNRRKTEWRDRHEMEHTGKDGAALPKLQVEFVLPVKN